MANTFDLASNIYDGRYMRLSCVQTKDIATNKSKIDWVLETKGGNSNYYATGPTTVIINDQTVYSQDRESHGSYVNGLWVYNKKFPVIKGSVSGTIYVDHDSQGKKSIPVSFKTAIYVGATSTYSGTWTLDDIPRQAELTSAPNFTDLDNPTISYTNPAGNSVTELMACISLTGAVSDVGYRAISKVGTSETLSYQFPLTDAERNLLRNNTTSGSRTVYFYVRTKIGDTYFYSKSEAKTFSIVENDNTKPSISMGVSLDNGSLSSTFNGLYIQGKSKVVVNLSGQGKYKATITNHKVVFDGKTYNSASVTTDVTKTSGDMDVVGTVVDSRGFTKSSTQKINVIPYSKPLVIPIGSENAITCYRSDGNGKRVGNSTSVWIKAKRDYKTVTSGGVQKNFCALQWRRKLVSEAWDDGNTNYQWKDLIAKSNTTTSEYNALLPSTEFELTKSYTVQIMAIDDIGEKDVKTFEIPTQDVALHLGKGGKNVSIGTYCDYSTPYRFFCEWEGKFDKGLWGTSLNNIVTDVLKFAEECPSGLTPIVTNDTTDRSNLPNGYYGYSVGIIHKRQEGQCYVYLTDYMSGKIAINFLLNGTWSGWKYITPQ